ncbi:MAG: molybdopterin-binding protein [Candidatus Ozemobacteraceae bacterium]
MKISARNVLKGTVLKITEGAVNAEIILEIASGVKIVSVITKSSVAELGLKVGKQACAVIKASSVLVGVDE